jgi:pimeloyl-ACP methyl ester carboxylesterase
MKKLILLYLLAWCMYVPANSQNLISEVTGKGQKIVLIPGLASSGEVWKETVSDLSKNYECHVLTLPGFAGNAPINLENGFMEPVKNMLKTYIQDLESPILLMGHSLGGFLSLKLAAEIPDQIQKVIIIDSYPFYSAALNPNATVESMNPMANQLKHNMIAMSSEQFQSQQSMGMATMTSSQDRIPTLLDWSNKSDRKTIAHAIYELMVSDARAELEEVKCPILVLGAWYAGKDFGMTAESVGKNFENQYKLAENVQIEMAPTAYHFIMWDNPEWMMEQINNLLQ